MAYPFSRRALARAGVIPSESWPANAHPVVFHNDCVATKIIVFDVVEHATHSILVE
jgi:hypothetical protein